MLPSPPGMTPSGDYSFTPSDDGLLAFLRRKLAGEPLPAAAAAHFHDADIYAAGPADLTALYVPAPAKKGEGDCWYFFTHVRPKSSRDTRKSRQVAGGVGTWHSERAPRAVFDDEGNCIGHFQYFSFKTKNGNSSERTKWYMVEFNAYDQEGNHDHIRGGKPLLVLCKIYEAHSSSRSLSTRKRKPTDEHLNQATSPVKAKCRLFNSPAPSSLAAVSQEQISYEPAAPLESLHNRMEAQPSQDKEESKASPEQFSSTGCYEFAAQFQSVLSELESKLWQDEATPKASLEEQSRAWFDYASLCETLHCGMESKLSQDRAEPEAFQEQFNSRGWNESAVQLETLHGGLDSKPSQDEVAPEPSQDELVPEASQEQFDSIGWYESAARSESLHSRMESKSSQDEAEPEVLQEQFNSSALRNWQDKSNATSDSTIRPEQELLHEKVSESIIDRFWTLETEVPQLGRATTNCSFPMTGGAPRMPVCCASGALSSASWIGNDTMASTSSELGSFLGGPMYNELSGIAGGGFTGQSDVRSTPFAAVPPDAVASWFFSSPHIWSC